jgi:hypothetical protein
MAAQPAMAERECLVASEDEFSRDVIGLAAAWTLVIAAKRVRFGEHRGEFRHHLMTLQVRGQPGPHAGEPYICQRRNTMRTIDAAPSMRSTIVIPRNTTPYGPTMRSAATTGGSIGSDSFTAHATAAPTIAAVHSFAT